MMLALSIDCDCTLMQNVAGLCNNCAQNIPRFPKQGGPYTGTPCFFYATGENTP